MCSRRHTTTLCTFFHTNNKKQYNYTLLTRSNTHSFISASLLLLLLESIFGFRFFFSRFFRFSVSSRCDSMLLFLYLYWYYIIYRSVLNKWIMCLCWLTILFVFSVRSSSTKSMTIQSAKSSWTIYSLLCKNEVSVIGYILPTIIIIIMMQRWRIVPLVLRISNRHHHNASCLLYPCRCVSACMPRDTCAHSVVSKA